LQRGSELKFEVTKVKESLRSVYSNKETEFHRKKLNLQIPQSDFPEFPLLKAAKPLRIKSQSDFVKNSRPSKIPLFGGGRGFNALCSLD
jgi:hypothetical protein